MTTDQVTVTATFGRHKFLPWGIEGGRDGSRNEVRFVHDDGREVVVGKSARYRLKAGEVARLITGTGGGWGDALQRPVEAVLEDLRDGMVTFEQAEHDYGLVVNRETLEVERLTPERERRSGRS